MPPVPLSPRNSTLLDRLILPALGCVALLAIVVIIGWFAKIPMLMQIAPSWVPMQFNTALLFVLSSVSGMLALTGRHKLAIPIAGVVGLVAGLTLAQYLFDISFGIDEALMTAHTTVKTSHPGRMAPNTAIAFILSALMVFGSRWIKANSFLVVVFSTLVLCIALLALYGYLTDTESTYGWGNFTRMAVHTAVGFFILGSSFLLEAWFVERSRSGRSRIPSWVPFVTCFVALSFGLCIWNTISALETQNVLKEAKMKGDAIQVQVHSAFDSVHLSLKQMGKRYENGVRGPNWALDAEQYLKMSPGLFAIAFFREDNAPPRVISDDNAPLSSIEAWDPEMHKSKFSYGHFEQADLLYFAISLRVEIPESSEQNGTLVGFFEAEDFFSHALYPVIDQERLSIFDTHGNLILSNSNEDVAEASSYSDRVHIEDPAHQWYGEVSEPDNANLTALGVSLSNIAFVGTLLFGGFTFWGSTFAIYNYNLHRQRSDSEIRKANAELEALLHSISHDLREPIRTVSSFSGLLDEECAGCLKADSRHILDRLKGGAHRLEELHSDIATISRLHHLEMKHQKVPLKTLVEMELNYLRSDIESSGAMVTVAESLPSLLVEEKTTRQAIHHLIGNALKFSNRDSPPEISIEPYRGKKGKGIVVKDRGVGIQAPMDERLFQLFRRGVGRDVKGTGLGLAIVRKVAEKHGGEVWFRNRERGGTAFYLVLTSKKPQV